MRKTFPNRRLALGIISLALCMSSIFWVAISASSSADTRAVNSLGGVDSVNVLSQRANDIIYNALDSKLYISVPSIVGPTGNSIRRIDPMQLSVGTPVWVGSEPNKLSLSADGHSLYVGLDGAFSLRRFDTLSNTPDQQFALGFEFFAGEPYLRYGISDIAVSPTNPNVLGVARRVDGNAPRLEPTAIYTNGTALPETSGYRQDNGSIAFGSSESTLFGSGPIDGLRRMGVSETGISHTVTYSFCANADIQYDGGRIYCSTGEVIDAADPTLLYTFPESSTKAFVADGSVNRVFYLVRDQSVGTTWLLKAFDATTFALVGTLQFTNVAGDVKNLVRWGANGLAFVTTGGKVYVIQTSLIPTENPVPTPSGTPFTTPTPTPTPIETSYRYVPMAANNGVYDPDNQKLYVSLPSNAGSAGNSIGIVDPAGANLEQAIWIGSEPNKLAMSSDRQKLYVGLDGSRTVREFSLVNSTAGSEYPIGIDPSNGPMAIMDLVASPDSPSIIAVARRSTSTSEKSKFGMRSLSSGLSTRP